MDNEQVIQERKIKYKEKTHIVLISGGLSSFEVGIRVIKKFGKENTRLWFFDTLIEDEDVYRFLRDSQSVFGKEIEIYRDGRNPWQVFRDERFIGNSRVPLCNRVLKREVLEKLLKRCFPQKNVTLYLGYDYFETKRMERSKRIWNKKGYGVEFPLKSPPFYNKSELISLIKKVRLLIPKLYCNGFSHNNCGGACVQAGIRQWSKLWREFPERYIWHEEQEEITRCFLNKDVSILRDRRNNNTKPLTLKQLRLRIDKKMRKDGNGNNTDQ